MSLAIGRTIEGLATTFPGAARCALSIVARVHRATGREPGWRFEQLASRLQYRAPAVTRLGNGLRIKVPWADVGGREICRTGWYEADTVRHLTALLSPGMTFLDVGAAFGQYTLLAAQIVGGTGQVHAFEPESLSHAWLEDNVRRNDLNNVIANRLALGDAEGSLELYVAAPGNLGATSLRKQYNFSGRTESVPVSTLDRYLASKGVSRVDVMKIDVEGAELSVFNGAQRMLSSHPALVIEFEESNQSRFGTSCAELAAFLHARGYELSSILESECVPFTERHIQEHRSFNVIAKHVKG